MKEGDNVAKGDKLSEKEERFCLELVKNAGNATQAYKDAGYVVKNDNVAAVKGAEKLRKAKVQQRLAELRAPEKKKTVMSIEERRERLTRIADDEDSSNLDVMKAIDLLNKMDSLYLQRQEITGAVPVTIIEDVPEND